MSKEPRQNARAILAANMRTLIRRAGSQPELVRQTKVPQKTISRAANDENAANLDTINDLAAGIGLHPWQLLVPSLDPDNPPMLAMQNVPAVAVQQQRVQPGALSRLAKHGGPIGPALPRPRQRKRGTDE